MGMSPMRRRGEEESEGRIEEMNAESMSSGEMASEAVIIIKNIILH